MRRRPKGLSHTGPLAIVAVVAVAAALTAGAFQAYLRFAGASVAGRSAPAAAGRPVATLVPASAPRNPRLCSTTINGAVSLIQPWKPEASLEEISALWRGAGYRGIAALDNKLADQSLPDEGRATLLFKKAAFLSWEGEAEKAYRVLEELRSLVERDPALSLRFLASAIYLEGVTGLRRGETDNCIMCRGESSCILPIAPAARHTNPIGSRLAIKHFTEYLAGFPADLEVRWLLNLAHMTLGEYPEKVDARYRLDLSRFFHSEFDIGRFRDVGHLVGVNRFNQAGGAIMEDFDNDGLLDLAVSSFDCTQPMSYYHNNGDGTFEDRSQVAGVTAQLGGMVCYQADYDNDGNMDIFVARGAWFPFPIRPSLLRNMGAGRFIDVTETAGLLDPVNSIAACWGDYDNDGWVDLFVACERQTNRLFHNKGNGTFDEVAAKAGLQADPAFSCKGCNWIDYDNDDYPDLFVDNLKGTACLYHNNRDGTFTDLTSAMGISGPVRGFSCWAWDYDNDGWLDIFATCYDLALEDVVRGLLGQPHSRYSNRLYRNAKGKGFEDVTREAGLDVVFATMGSNFGDFDNDGWLDMYLGTGEPSLATIIPNRMFKNVGGRRFADITSSSGTGQLQKGHGVACGDWDRDGDVDIFTETGGAINGDKYHNILFQNPGQGNHWLTVKLIGKKTNRAALGARIMVVAAGEKPLVVHRHISSGSSFGGNTLQQTIGLGKATGVSLLEIHWPASGTTQVFHDIVADQAIEVTEFASSFRPLQWKPIPQPQ
jgi:hypothetical protein